MKLQMYRLAPGEFEKLSAHRPRIVQCLVPDCQRKFADKVAREKHLKDKHRLVRVP